MGYLKAEAEIRPKGNFFVVDTEYVGHNGSDLKSIISAIQTAESSASTAISGLDTRITANTTSISGLDTRVTALEESGGGGGGGTTNYNELSNIPQINGVNLKGNLSADDIGLVSRTTLESNIDLNTVKSPGFYKSTGTGGTNKPDGMNTGFALIVNTWGNSTFQMINNSASIYVRRYSSSKWSTWKLLIDF